MSGSYQKTYFKRKVLGMINYGKKRAKTGQKKHREDCLINAEEYKNISLIVFNQKDFNMIIL